jgi:hypothetical protein
MSRVEKAREWMMRGADASTSKRLGMFLRPVFLVSMIVLALVVAWLYPDSRQEARALPLASAAHPPAGLTEQTTSKLPFRRQLGAIIAEPRRRSRDHSLESAFAQLAADADAGDRFSSCLLSRALALCDEAESLRRSEQDWTEIAVRADHGSSEESYAISKISRITEPVRISAVLCKGLSPDRLNETAERMLQSAKLGDPRAMAHFALYSRPPENTPEAQTEYEREYREYAVTMLERSASLGNFRAMRSLYEVYLHGVSPNRSESIRVDPDPVSALAIGTVLLQKVAPQEKGYLAATMDSIENKLELMSSRRYVNLLAKYSRYMDEISMRGFDDSGMNLDLASCKYAQ